MGKTFNMTGGSGGGGGGISLSSIAITTPPTKTTYQVGETFDATGMVVTATYSNGATLVVGGYTYPQTPLAAGTTGVTISYTEAGVTRTTTQAITVAKPAPTITISPSSMVLDRDHLTATATIATDSDGALSVSSDDTSVATVALSGTTITVNSVNDTTGTATITVSQAETANYEAGSATISVTAQFTSIYGVSWDGSASSACTRTDAATLFADPVPYVAGMTAAQCSSPFDGLMPWAGMTRQVSTAAGEMVKIPKFWYKITAVGTKGVKIQIADGAVDGFAVCPACMDRGDGAGERDYVLVGRYHCAASDYRSKTGENPKASVAQNAFRVACHNLGANIYMMDFATRFTLLLLYIVEFANWNSQETIGYGCSPSGAVFAMGYTDSMPYHTGTTAASRTTYGGTQYRYVEGLWDNVYDRLTGCYNGSGGLYITLNPANFAEDSGGVAVGTPVAGWTSGWAIASAAGFAMLIPSEAGGSGSSYVGDYWYFSTSNPVVCACGYYANEQSNGMWHVFYTSLTQASTAFGSRLMEFPPE